MSKMTLIILSHLNVYDPTTFPLTVRVKGAAVLFSKPTQILAAERTLLMQRYVNYKRS